MQELNKDLEHLEKLAGNARRFIETEQHDLAAWTLRNLAETAQKVYNILDHDALASELADITGDIPAETEFGEAPISDLELSEAAEEPSVDRG